MSFVLTSSLFVVVAGVGCKVWVQGAGSAADDDVGAQTFAVAVAGPCVRGCGCGICQADDGRPSDSLPSASSSLLFLLQPSPQRPDLYILSLFDSKTSLSRRQLRARGFQTPTRPDRRAESESARASATRHNPRRSARVLLLLLLVPLLLSALRLFPATIPSSNRFVAI